MRSFAIAILIFICLKSSVVAADEKRNLSIEFTQIISGHSFQRESDDRLNAAVIWEADGYRKFLERYHLPVAGFELTFDKNHVFVVGFSDNLQEAFCDGVSHKSRPAASSYYLDLHATGLKFKRREPPDGMKYSCWVLVRIPRPEAISSIQIREGVVGGLCEQFGNR